MKEIYQSSPQALNNTNRRGGIKEAKYPWKQLQVRQSFTVAHNEVKLSSFRPLVSRMGKKYGKKFTVIDHGPEIGYEVACLPMTEAEAVATSSNIVEALGKVKE